MVGKIYRNIIFIQLSISILSLLGSNIDNIIVGKFLSAEALAACGLVLPVVQMASVLSGVITTGIKTVCSRSVGAGNKKKANDEISSAAVFSIIVFTAACILGYVFVNQIAAGLAGSDSSELFYYVRDYMLGYLLVIPSLGVLSLFIYILQMNNQAAYCTGAAVAFIVFNIGFDIAAVWFNMGLLGIGLSTSISYFIMIGILLTGYFRVNTTLRISLKVFKWKHLGNIVVNGLTNAIATGTSMVIKMIVNMVVLQAAGTDALAAVTVIVSFAGILMAVAKAIAYCTDMASGMFYGERNVKELCNVVYTFVKYSVIFNVCIAAVVAATSDWCCLLFINADEAAYPMAVSALRLFTLSMVFFSISDCFVYFLLGIKKPVYAYVLAALINVGLGVFSALLIPTMLVDGAALAYVFGYFTVFVLIILFFCLRNRSNPFKPSTYMVLPEGFEIPEDHIFEKEIDNVDEVLFMSKQVGEFCKKLGADLRTRMAISLAIEELGINVCEHGMKKNKKYLFEIRVIYDADKKTWIVRTRDDCREFNPVRYLEMHESKDKTNNLGVGLVLNMAKHAQYYNTMGLNNLVVEF